MASENAERAGDDIEFHYRVRVPGPEGEMTLILESELYMAAEPPPGGGFGRRARLYPVTVVQARYNGTYEGAPWLAFPVRPYKLSGDAGGWRGWDSSDLTCDAWFRLAADEGWLVGRGSCPDAAYDNLLDALCASAGVERAELEAEPAWPRREGEPEE